MYSVNPICILFTIVAVALSGCESSGIPDTGDGNTITYSPGRAPGPGEIVINEFLADPAGDITGDANGDGLRDSAEDEFIELVNTSPDKLDLEGVYITDNVGTKHIFPADTSLEPGKAAVVFGGGTPALSLPADVQLFVSSEGGLGLNNSGDIISVYDNLDNLVISYSYGSGEADSDQSITLSPDLDNEGSGTDVSGYENHSDADTADGSLFSPGTKIDGSAF